MSRWTDGMQLQIIFVIRKNTEISLHDLHKSMFGTEEFNGYTDEAHFCSALLNLYHAKFVDIYIKPVNSESLSPTSKKDNIDEETVRGILNHFKEKASLADGYGLMGVKHPEDVYLSITDYFYRVQEAIGFSVSDELSEKRRHWYHESIWGTANQKLHSQVFVIMPFADSFTPIYEDHISKVCKKIGYSCLRADLITSNNVIMNDIWSMIITPAIK